VPYAFGGSRRGSIVGLSNGAACRMRRYLREALADYRQMVTLTYPGGYPLDGRVCKEHLRRFLQELKREHARAFLINPDLGERHSSFWFLEFQNRGAPHFHIFTTWAPGYAWVAKRWYEIVGSDDVRHLHAGTRTEYLRSGRLGTIAYASKYAVKQEQKQVPEFFSNVGRMWGVCGYRSTLAAATYVDSTQQMFNKCYSTLKSLFLYVQQQTNLGNIEIVLRDTGIVILQSMNVGVMRRLRGYVGLLTAKTGVYENLFTDADLEGEDLPW